MRLISALALIALTACAMPITGTSKGAVKPIPMGAIETTTLAPLPAAQTDAAKADAVKADAPKTEAPKTDAVKAEAPQTEAPQTDAPTPVAPAPRADVQPKPVLLPPSSPEEAACRDGGGTWARAGKLAAMTCYKATKDAGQACSKQTDCTSQCLARSRTCAPIWPIFGCTEVLQNDGARVTLCID